MRKVFQLAVALTLILSVTLVAQNAEQSPVNPKVIGPTNTEAMWDILFSFSATTSSGAAGNAGAEFDGTYFYSTRWASNLIHQYDATGTLVSEFSIPGVSGLRDLAFDGTYFYGGAASTTIYQMDFSTHTLIGTITSPVAVRHIAYDDANDAFWCGDWSTAIHLVSRAGATLAQFGPTVEVTSCYGSAYDDVTPGGPYLWIFGQSGTGGEIHAYSIPSGTYAGMWHDAVTDFGAAGDIAGGLFIDKNNYLANYACIGGLLQGVTSGDAIFMYELSPTLIVGPGPATNPTPANGATGVGIDDDLYWDNAAGATSIEIFFNGTSVYSGAPVATWDPGTLDYMTSYTWKVNQTDGTGTTGSPTWSFTTMQDPNYQVLFSEDFADLSQWTIVGPLGLTNWSAAATANAGGTAPELRFSWSPSFVGDSYIMGPVVPSAGLPLIIELKHFWDFYATPAAGGISYTTDDGTTWTDILSIVDPAANIGPETVTLNQMGDANFRLGFYYSGDSFNIDYWYIDDVEIATVVPVEFTSFAANVNNGNVVLNWSTATETNNSGFSVERSNDQSSWTTLGFVNGFGTTTEPQNYSYTDNTVSSGTYYYRLKQVDLSGQFEYSSVVSIELIPTAFALEQNYPNPFNPTTTIEFALPVQSQVTIRLYNTLGQEVAQLLNSNFEAGTHQYNLNASNLSSGAYFYTIEANGVDGNNFVATKKLMLMK